MKVLALVVVLAVVVSAVDASAATKKQKDALSKHMKKIESGSKMWGMFTDFNFYSIEPLRALYVEGFGKAYEKNYKD